MGITANKASLDAIAIYNQAITYGTSGNADGKAEYIGHAVPGASTAEPRWLVKKLTYDASGRVIKIQVALDAYEEATFVHIFDNASSLNYGT